MTRMQQDVAVYRSGIEGSSTLIKFDPQLELLIWAWKGGHTLEPWK
jgi:hypothetical protein